jgi:hemolysin activation/secretion protein
MEPLIAVATAIASSVMTKFWEKNGEIIAEETFAASKHFTQKLREKVPNTSTAIERVTEEPLDYGRAILEVEAITKTDIDLLEAAQRLANAAVQDSNPQLTELVRVILHTLQNQQSGIQNVSKVADEIQKSFINQGHIQSQVIHFH